MPESFHFDLFISYSHRDNSDGYISKLVARIQKEYRDFTGGKQLHAFFEKDEIGSRVDRQRSPLDGICSSRLLLICLSPNYLESEYCSWEFNEYLRHKAALAPGANGVPPVYFVEISGQNDKGFERRAAEWVTEVRRRQNFDFRPWFDEGAEALKETAVRTLLKSAEDQTGDGLGDIRRAIRAKGLVDRHSDHFVGRWTELCRLREIVAFGKPGMITVINGQDGIGKTALATEYSHAFAHEYPGGCWQVPCRDREDLRVALANMAGARDLEFEFTEEEKRDLDLGLARLLSELKQRADSAEPSRVLLLLDNVDRPKLLQARQIRQLPRAEWLHVIATTRFLELELFSRRKDVTCMTLNALPQGDALALIERFQPGGNIPRRRDP